MTFEQLAIIAPILKALKEKNYIEPTPIQEQAIPLILNKKDLMGSAQTGTGKTAAFAIPILQHLSQANTKNKNSRTIKALVITPTRELAIQIGDSFSTYGKYTGIRNTVIYGGVSQHKQTNDLRKGVDVLVATPGRLLDLINQGYIHLNSIEYFVIDEADRMLDMGFIHDIRKIIAMLPAKRQSLFFSATLPKDIIELSRKILHNPEKVAVNPASYAAETIKHYMYYTNKCKKKDLLNHILQDKNIDQVLLFSRTKHGADKIARNLKKKNITTAAIHGDKAQNHRQKSLKQFKDGHVRVLVATDIAARGIDIEQLGFVINYDIPEVAETYVHRIGRSGRAGETGTAISICEPEENTRIKGIEKLIHGTISTITDNPFPQTERPMNTQEKKQFEKEKQRRKQAFFANRNKSHNRKRY